MKVHILQVMQRYKSPSSNLGSEVVHVIWHCFCFFRRNELLLISNLMRHAENSGDYTLRIERLKTIMLSICPEVFPRNSGKIDPALL